MLKLALVGENVSRSLSPALHTFLLKEMGKTCEYDLLSVPPRDFSSAAEELFRSYDAFNVTIPYKREILPYLSSLRGDAARFRSVNTVSARTREGFNTDGEGFALMLEEAGIPMDGTVLVLGAGGAGRSVIGTLAGRGATVYVYNRSAERLAEAFREMGNFLPLEEIPLRRFDLVVNCTGAGMPDSADKTPEVRFEGGRRLPVGEELLSRCGACADLIYDPAESEFLRVARSLGKPAVNGGGMLFYQAYLADCIFSGKTPSAAEARRLRLKYREAES